MQNLDKKGIVFSLGGSLVVPKRIDWKFLRRFRNFILKLIPLTKRVVIVVGGGNLSREYNKAAELIAKISDKDLDFLGISATKLNAELIRVILSKQSFEKVVNRPRKIRTKKQIIVASGWKPGCSTDKDAVLWAKHFNISSIINLTNIDFVYSADPKKDPHAQPLGKIGWKDYLKIIPSNWSPRLSTPFDPVASRIAKKNKIRVVILNGYNLRNIWSYFRGKGFKGTVIG